MTLLPRSAAALALVTAAALALLASVITARRSRSAPRADRPGHGELGCHGASPAASAPDAAERSEWGDAGPGEFRSGRLESGRLEPAECEPGNPESGGSESSEFELGESESREFASGESDWDESMGRCVEAGRHDSVHDELRARGRASPPRPVLSDWRSLTPWVALSAVLLLAAAERQWGVLSWLAHVGREIARTTSLYDLRRGPQKVLVYLVMACVVGFAALSAWHIRRRGMATLLALAATTYWLSFVLTRAVSHHRVDYLLRQFHGPLTANAWIELTGLSLAAIALLAALAENYQRKSLPPPTMGKVAHATQSGPCGNAG